MRAEGRRVVATNGCFDLLHVGHVRYLEEARSLGDVLVVGINSDSSAGKLKGSGRPVNSASERAEVVASLHCVTAVTIFDEDTALELVEVLKPDVYVKGGDYSADPEDEAYPPEAHAVSRDGGKVAIVSLTPGRSTTRILEQIAEDRTDR